MGIILMKETVNFIILPAQALYHDIIKEKTDINSVYSCNFSLFQNTVSLEQYSIGIPIMRDP